MEDSRTNQLWVSLSALSDGNIFAFLPKLLQKMLVTEKENKATPADEAFDIILPSNDIWQTKIYYKLVEKQRKADALEEDMQISPEFPTEIKFEDWTETPKRKTSICSQSITYSWQKLRINPITWTVSDIAKAGKLLTTPPLPTEFEDEQEMRRVYTLIYDVFRYKNIMMHALNDVEFFLEFPQLKECTSQVWLLFYDLYHRNFTKRETAVLKLVTKLFKEANLSEIESALWEKRIKLAASISRLRIEKNALSLSELLPSHLRDEKIIAQVNTKPVTCWVNTNKVKNSKELRKEIESAFKMKYVENNHLSPENYAWDKHCPHTVAFHASFRTELARSQLVKSFKLIVQDKSFCLGPATFGKLVSQLELTGNVIQTHVNSPRTTAYLANILAQNEKINELMAFSAGKRKFEYETYFTQLGMTNVRIFADKLVDISPDANYMEEVVAVFATPPNSYSAVTDPIDLVCSRGGDLSMLEVLTESEETQEGKSRVYDILEEQRKTLKFAMSRPQIQFVLYETHSEMDVENKDMVQETLKVVNKVAKLQHAHLQNPFVSSKFTNEGEDKEINNITDSTTILDKPEESDVNLNNQAENSDDDVFEAIKVPETDIFDTPSLPMLCGNNGSCTELTRQGCYLALIQRKQVIRLDNKYMIQMAENRGLFGKTSASNTRSKTHKSSRKKEEKPLTPPQKFKRRIKDTEVARIAAPTHTFLRHIKTEHEISPCSRCPIQEINKEKTPIYKQWWSETTRHIMQLRSSLVRNKVVPTNNSKGISNTKYFINSLINQTKKIDEIVACSREENMPIFPRLKLTREVQKIEKVKLDLSITEVAFRPY